MFDHLTKIQDYTILQNIGEGSFATVKLGVHLPTKTKVAIKIVPIENFQDPDHTTRFQREVMLIKSIDHPFVAEFFELLEDEHYFYIIMEYVEGGNLLDYVNAIGMLTENEARKYFIQMISIFDYLHNEMKIVHRDLKAENVLLDRHCNIRLIDFGLSNKFTNENPYLSTACGSPAYASPEMIKGEEYTAASDIWSAGILLFAMTHGELPYDDDNMQRLLQKIAYSSPNYSDHISPQLYDLLTKLLEKDPKERITLQEIKEHPWFSHSDYANIVSNDNRISSKLFINPNEKDRTIDREIINKMAALGYNCTELAESLFMKESTSLTAVYRMLRKEKITDMLVENNLISPRPKIEFKFTKSMINRPPIKDKPITVRRESNLDEETALLMRSNHQFKPMNLVSLKTTGRRTSAAGTHIHVHNTSVLRVLRRPHVNLLMKRKSLNSNVL
ncbi:CAMK family protein kinase [Tritrichomonas foetus]|uniref:Mitogen-activated protein kinase n=1 Tax=Tritrichomonas foetus TaxID=1144522 RepID=A0A1J4KTA8_9EUKA|nr:CAMK family protein kinase [Tritrichomonas foetus]|eukprot:OHT14483.1 CAMK family protein kinase [Tritrichomonas foetus]